MLLRLSNHIFNFTHQCPPVSAVRMQAKCGSLDASQLLRDILQSKDSYQAQFSDSINSSGSIKDIYATDCSSEMISPLLHSKSSDMAFNDRDNDNDLDNDNDIDGDIDVATDNNSCINDDDQSDDLDERSLDASVQEDTSKSFDHETDNRESKEEKRAHVEIILTSMRQPLPQDATDPTMLALSGDFKRQKRKQPQPQQHESNMLHTEELVLQRQIQQLQEQMQAVKRKREEDLSIKDEEPAVGADVTDGEGSKPGSPQGGESKRARVESILSSIQSPAHVDNGFEFSNRVSPGSDSGKKQKRKQTQPQQHDNSRSDPRDGSNAIKHPDNHHRFGSRHDDNNLINEDGNGEMNNSHGSIYGTDHLFRNTLYHGLGNKNFITPFQNGFDPHFYRENLFRHGMFGLRPDFDPVNVFRSKSMQIRPEHGHISDEPPKIHQADISKIANVFKLELTQAMNKAIDNAVSKVLTEKQATVPNAQPLLTGDSNTSHIQQQQNGQLQQHKSPSSQQQQQQQSLKLQHSPNPISHFIHQQHFQQLQQQQHRHQSMMQQQQHQQQQQNQQTSQTSDREAMKETVNNCQTEKKPDLIVPLSDHLHLLERFGSTLHQDKMSSAFGPLHKSGRDLITPHNGPSLSFHPNFQYFFPTQVLPPLYTGEPEQTEALPLLVNTPKKKRTKVTDTRLTSPRGKPALLQDNITSSSMDHTDAQRHLAIGFPQFLPPVLPTSVAITNPSLTHPSLTHSDLLALRLQEASFRESRMTSPHDQSRGSPQSPSDSPHYLTSMDMFERGSLSMSGDMMDGSSPSNGLMISFFKRT